MFFHVVCGIISPKKVTHLGLKKHDKQFYFKTTKIITWKCSTTCNKSFSSSSIRRGLDELSRGLWEVPTCRCIRREHSQQGRACCVGDAFFPSVWIIAIYGVVELCLIVSQVLRQEHDDSLKEDYFCNDHGEFSLLFLVWLANVKHKIIALGGTKKYKRYQISHFLIISVSNHMM